MEGRGEREVTSKESRRKRERERGMGWNYQMNDSSPFKLSFGGN